MKKKINKKAVDMGNVVPSKMNPIMRASIQKYHKVKGKSGSLMNQALGGRFG